MRDLVVSEQMKNDAVLYVAVPISQKTRRLLSREMFDVAMMAWGANTAFAFHQQALLERKHDITVQEVIQVINNLVKQKCVPERFLPTPQVIPFLTKKLGTRVTKSKKSRMLGGPTLLRQKYLLTKYSFSNALIAVLNNLCERPDFFMQAGLFSYKRRTRSRYQLQLTKSARDLLKAIVEHEAGLTPAAYIDEWAKRLLTKKEEIHGS